jgi:FdhD protein
MKSAKEQFRIINVSSKNWKPDVIDVICESPVTITVNGVIWLTFMCTPHDLEALAVGFLFNDGIIDSIEEIASVRVCSEGDNVDVWLKHHVEKPTSWYKTSGCAGGMTSVNDVRNVENSFKKRITNGAQFSTSQVLLWIEWLLDLKGLYREAGGVHTSALIDGKRVLFFTEDIGRHNTLDKIAGRCLLEHVDPQNKIIITTGRVSSEMLHKSARIGASILVSRTSPTSLSIKLAEKFGITLIGYARRDRFQVYTHPQRIQQEESSVLWHKSLR